MKTLCMIGGFVLAGLFILFLMIDIAVIRVEQARKNMEESKKSEVI